MKEEDFEIAVKVLIVGNGGVGKSSLIRRFCSDTFTEQYKKTIGVDFLEKQQYVPALGETVTLMCWDTAGQDEFDTVTKNYYRGAGAAVLVFSTIDRQSYTDIEKWQKKIVDEIGNVPMALMQNKVDLIDQAVVTSQEAEELASKLNVRFYRTSVKENLNVNQLFEYLAECYVQKGSTVDTTPTVGTLDFSGSSIATQKKEKEETPNIAASPSSDDIEKQTKTDTFQLAPQTPAKQRTKGKKSKCLLM
eukprot:TRINITY_DN3316_c0_g1_i1.p1 TRINITY_DN3316_c0_g1~~TRINITY_DN3316_c0_g1_i1.p1  ORF type:complete len:248 (-),score=61.96 TRINITY_DN3316_c0_g1_i1:191-934(-)